VTQNRPWKVLIVDDADEVRTMTKIALENFRYLDTPLELLEAASADEARTILSSTEDIAVAILDVVMETQHAGLDLVHWIRKEQHNPLIRLLVRTGQAGLFPASKVLVEYDINDYWEKTELTYGRFHSALTTSLRGYQDMVRMHRRTLQLRQWADRFPDLLGVRDWSSLLRLVMLRLKELFPDTVVSAFVCRNDGARWPVLSGIGNYPQSASDILESLDETKAQLLLDAWNTQSLAEDDQGLALYFEVPGGPGHVFYLDVGPSWAPYERNVGRLVLQNFRAALENRILIHNLERHEAELSSETHRQTDDVRQWHHRFQQSLQVVISSLELETHEKTGVSGRSPLQGVQRRLQALTLLHSLLSQEARTATVDLHDYLQLWIASLGEKGRWEYIGVPLHVSSEEASAHVLALTEAADLVMAPRWNGRRKPQITLSDQPKAISFGNLSPEVEEAGLKNSLEWRLLESHVQQLGGYLKWSPPQLTIYLSDD